MIEALGLLFYGNSKRNPVEGIALFVLCVIAIIWLNKVLGKGTQTEANVSPNQIPREKLPLAKRFWRSILQMIDFFCSIYFRWGFRPNDEPFRRATKSEKRVGGCFMALLPAFFAVVMTHTQSFDAMVDSMMYGHVWMGWFYLGFIAVVGGGVWFAIKVAPKIPLYVSVPVAMVTWPILAWFLWRHNP